MTLGRGFCVLGGRVPRLDGCTTLTRKVLQSYYRDIRTGARGYTTPVKERTVTTSIRVTPSMRDQLRRIAEHERRTTNNWIRIVLEDAITRYLDEHPELSQTDAQGRRS